MKDKTRNDYRYPPMKDKNGNDYRCPPKDKNGNDYEYPPAMVRTIKQIPNDISHLSARIKELEAENDRLDKRVVELLGNCTELQMRAEFNEEEKDEARAEVAGLRERWEALREWGLAEQRMHHEQNLFGYADERSGYREGLDDEARQWLGQLNTLERAGEGERK